MGCFWSVATVAAPVVIEDIAFTAQPGARLEVRLTFSEPPSADIESYTIEEPARIVLDFPDTKSGLDQKRFSLSQANATSVMVLESGDRTRMIVNLVDLVPFRKRGVRASIDPHGRPGWRASHGGLFGHRYFANRCQPC